MFQLLLMHTMMGVELYCYETTGADVFRVENYFLNDL